MSVGLNKKNYLEEQLPINRAGQGTEPEMLIEAASMIAHDLRGPLCTVQSLADILKWHVKEGLEDDASATADKISSTTRRLTHLVENLLSFAKCSSLESHFEMLNLGDVVDAVLNDLAEDISESGIQIDCDELPNIEADRMQVYQLFANLIGNAIKYRSKDGIATLEIKYESSSTRDVRIRFKDNGVGFDDNQRYKIFHLFHRAHGDAMHEGLGLGLAICKRIVENHKGQINAWSESGATFEIKLPIFQNAIA